MHYLDNLVNNVNNCLKLQIPSKYLLAHNLLHFCNTQMGYFQNYMLNFLNNENSHHKKDDS